MEKTFDTKFGEVTLRHAMIDTDGTNLADGIEIKIDGELVAEVLDQHLDLDEITIEEVEEFVNSNCEL
jgi:hypothetical protein